MSNLELIDGEIDALPLISLAPILGYPKSYRRIIAGSNKVKNPPVGEVVVEIVIQSTGSVEFVNVITSTHEDFTAVVRPYVAGSKFTPPLKNGKPVDARFKWRILVPQGKSMTKLDSMPQLLYTPPISFPHSQIKTTYIDNKVVTLPSEGRVTLEILISQDGSVARANVVSASHQDFVEKAKYLARRSQFTPPIMKGKKVQAVLRWPLVFRP